MSKRKFATQVSVCSPFKIDNETWDQFIQKHLTLIPVISIRLLIQMKNSFVGNDPEQSWYEWMVRKITNLFPYLFVPLQWSECVSKCDSDREIPDSKDTDRQREGKVLPVWVSTSRCDVWLLTRSEFNILLFKTPRKGWPASWLWRVYSGKEEWNNSISCDVSFTRLPSVPRFVQWQPAQSLSDLTWHHATIVPSQAQEAPLTPCLKDRWDIAMWGGRNTTELCQVKVWLLWCGRDDLSVDCWTCNATFTFPAGASRAEPQDNT